MAANESPILRGGRKSLLGLAKSFLFFKWQSLLRGEKKSKASNSVRGKEKRRKKNE